jgi:antitoxin component of RelBE/YafQ-DinJ toxin-antitoxin module
MAETPRRSFRIKDKVYTAAQAAAYANDETLSDVVNAFLVTYAKQHQRRVARESAHPSA